MRSYFDDLSISKKLVFSGIVTTATITLLMTFIALWKGKLIEDFASKEATALAREGQVHNNSQNYQQTKNAYYRNSNCKHDNSLIKNIFFNWIHGCIQT